VTLIARDAGSTESRGQGESLAAALNDAGLATLVVDLVAPGEQVEPMDVAALDVLSQRLVAATNWLRSQPETALCALSYFGEDSVSAAVLVAAAKLRAGIAAVVSCGGRPDAAKSWLGRVVAPVLLIAGDPDAALLSRAQEARRHVTCISDLAVIDGPVCAARGTDRVSRLAVDWFTRHSYELAAARDALRVVLLCRNSAAWPGNSQQMISVRR
jgi:putative phosphoribosyl transferase